MRLVAADSSTIAKIAEQVHAAFADKVRLRFSNFCENVASADNNDLAQLADQFTSGLRQLIAARDAALDAVQKLLSAP